MLRHEWKHPLHPLDLPVLRARLAAALTPDPHGDNGRYTIRSLYFDNLQDKALREKLDGVACREKFRLRYYGGDLTHLLLEKKSKIQGLCRKEQEILSQAQVEALLVGIQPSGLAGPPLLKELWAKAATQGLRPKTIVDYTREAYTFGPGNVRVTLDYGLRTGLWATGFLDPGCVTAPVQGAAVLEVKWDEFLPQFVRDLVQLPGTRTTAFSKYAACRGFL